MKKQFRFTKEANKLLQSRNSLNVVVSIHDAIEIILDLRYPSKIVSAIKIIEQSTEDFDTIYELLKYTLEEFINMSKEELDDLHITLEIKPLLQKLLKKIG